MHDQAKRQKKAGAYSERPAGATLGIRLEQGAADRVEVHARCGGVSLRTGGLRKHLRSRGRRRNSIHSLQRAAMLQSS